MIGIEDAFRALGEPNRRRIMDALLEQPRAVGDLVDRLGLSQPGTSKHLRVLRDARLVQVRVEGQRRVYEVCPGPLRNVEHWLAPYRRLWAASLARLEHELRSSEQEATKS